MKITINKKGLYKALKLAGNVTTGTMPLPCLESALITADSGKVALRVTNLENDLSQRLDKICTIYEDGIILVDMKRILALLGLISDEELTMETKTIERIIDKGEKNEKTVYIDIVEISADGGTYELANDYEDDTSYPSLKNTEVIVNKLFLSLPQLQSGLKKCYKSSDDIARPAMTGVFMDFKNDMLISTDAHTLCGVEYIFGIESEEAKSKILPMSIIKLIHCFDGDDITMEFDEHNQVRILVDGAVLVGMLIDAKYPNWKAVVPVNQDREFVFNKKELEVAIKKGDLFANGSTHRVAIKISGGVAEVSAKDLDLGIEAINSLPVKIAKGVDDDIIFGVNAKFILAALKNLDGDEVNLSMTNEERAMVLTGDDSEYFVLLMPIILG